MRGIGEAVTDAAIELQAPVDPGRRHLLLERRALLGRDERIRRADADQHLGLDVPARPAAQACRGRNGSRRSPSRRRRCARSRARWCRRSSSRSPRASPDRPPSVPPGVSSALWARRRMPVRSVRQGASRLAASARVGERLAVAVVVHGEGGVAQAREPRGDLPGVLGEAVALVANQDARTAAGAPASQSTAYSPIMRAPSALYSRFCTTHRFTPAADLRRSSLDPPISRRHKSP